jgi:MarR family transcriptional regulator, organic hydroperoxide resistance regulator
MTQAPETESLDVLFAQICRLKHARVQSLLEALGLYEGQPALLRSLWAQEGLTHAELARRLRVRPATVTKMIQRMEKSGFVERRPDPSDQRLSRVYLTGAGRSSQVAVRQVWRTLEKDAFSGLTDDERVQLQHFFQKIRENLLRVTAPR